MKRNWIFTSNTFDVATRGSNKKMLIIATDTDSKLAAQVGDPAIQAIYNSYHPIYEDYRAIYANYQIVAGERKGQTLNLETLVFAELPVKIRIWEPQVLIVYPEGSPEEKAIFPNGRRVFNTGAYEHRIIAVEGLAMKLAADPAFATLAPQVQSFYNLLSAARSTQQGKAGLVEELSSQRDNQRKLVAQSLYGTVLAGLMTKFAADASQIDNYFDLSLIRQHSSDSFPATSLEIRGTVTVEGSTTPVVSAIVMLEDVETSLMKIKASVEDIPATTTDDQGRYKFLFTDLPAGTSGVLKLIIDAPGFQHYEQIFPVTVGEVIVMDVPLALGMRKVA